MPLHAMILCLLLITSGLFNTTLAEELRLSSGLQRNTLIELYTSQGCSSCPPAERWLGSLQHDPRLWHEFIPVAFHVDYWDYIGWKDELARPAFSARQRRYHREGALPTVYTPGFVVNGREWRRWFGIRQPPRSNTPAGELSLTLDDGLLSAHFDPATQGEKELVLNVALLGVALQANITRGENAGKTLPQDFVVLAFWQQQSRNGQWQLTLPQPLLEAEGRPAIAAWVSRADTLTPLQAVGGWLPSGD